MVTDFGLAINIGELLNAPKVSHSPPEWFQHRPGPKYDLYTLGVNYMRLITKGSFDAELYRDKAKDGGSFSSLQLSAIAKSLSKWNSLKLFIADKVYSKDYLRFLVSQFGVKMPRGRKAQFLDLVTHLLEPDVRKRINVDEALLHPFLHD
jgi:serine/threonine protein kinase